VCVCMCMCKYVCVSLYTICFFVSMCVCVYGCVCMCVCVCVFNQGIKGAITVQLTSCLSGLDLSVLQIKTKIVSCHTADSKPVKQELNGTLILPPLVFPGLTIIYPCTDMLVVVVLYSAMLSVVMLSIVSF
jgi:hypothetical protein